MAHRRGCLVLNTSKPIASKLNPVAIGWEWESNSESTGQTEGGLIFIADRKDRTGLPPWSECQSHLPGPSVV